MFIQKISSKIISHTKNNLKDECRCGYRIHNIDWEENTEEKTNEDQSIGIDSKYLSDYNVEKLWEALGDSQSPKTKEKLRNAYRKGYWMHNTDWDENIGETICCMAEKYGVTTEHIHSRYIQFFNFSAHYYKYIDRPPLLLPMWNSFLDYESGGSNEWDKDRMFKEPLYESKDMNRYAPTEQTVSEEDIPY